RSGRRHPLQQPAGARLQARPPARRRPAHHADATERGAARASERRARRRADRIGPGAMTYRDLRCEIAEGVAVVTLDRPNDRNAFSGPMATSLAAAYRECDERDDVRAVVLTGAGNAFCVGADLSVGEETFAKREEADFSADPVAFPPWDVRKPVIAAINGHAVGIGLTLAMQCDVRLVANEAKLAFAHVRRGVLRDAHSHWTVPRAIGFARTAELF